MSVYNQGFKTLIIGVFISSPSGEGGGDMWKEKVKLNEEIKVFISSPSGEGGGFFQNYDRLYLTFSLVLLQAKAGGHWNVYDQELNNKVFISSPSGEGGGVKKVGVAVAGVVVVFSLVLLQAKAGGFFDDGGSLTKVEVFISSPSGEGGGSQEKKIMALACLPKGKFSLVLLQAKAGGSECKILPEEGKSFH